MGAIETKKVSSNFFYTTKIWEILLDNNDPSLLETIMWVYSWSHYYKDNGELEFLFMTDSGRTIGIVLVVITKEGFNRLPARKLRLRPSFIDPSRKKDVIREILNYAKKEERCWDIVDFSDIDYDLEIIDSFKSEVESLGFYSLIKEGGSYPYIGIDRSWEEYWSQRKGSFRKHLRYAQRRMAKLGNTNIIINTYDGSQKTEIKKALEEMFALSLKSWKSGIGTALGSTEENKHLYTELIGMLSRKAKIQFSFLEHKDIAIAGSFGVLYKDVFYFIKTCYDEQYKDISPGSILWYLVFKNIFAYNGVLRIELFNGIFEHKSKWLTNIHKKAFILVFRKSLYSRILKFSETHVRGWMGLDNNRGNGHAKRS